MPGVDVAGMLLSPTWSGGVRSGFGSGVSLGDGVREPLPEFPPSLTMPPPPQAPPTPQIPQAPLPPLPPLQHIDGDVVGGGRGGAARVLLQRAEEGGSGKSGGSGGGSGGGGSGGGEGDENVVGVIDDGKGGSGGGDGGRGGGGGGSGDAGGSDIGDTAAPAASSTAVGGSEIASASASPAAANANAKSMDVVEHVVVDDDDDSSQGSSTSNETGPGPTRPTRQNSQVWPLASSGEGTLVSASRGADGVGPNATSAGAAVGGRGGVGTGTGAGGTGTGDPWWEDGDGWHGVRGVGHVGGYDWEKTETHGAMYGGGGGGKEEASYMRWGAEGGVWYGDGYPGARGGGAGGGGEDGERQEGPWVQQAGAPARWSGFSEVGGTGVRPAGALGPGLEEHLPFMVTHTLVKVLRDPLLSAHYQVRWVGCGVGRDISEWVGVGVMEWVVRCLVQEAKSKQYGSCGI